MKIFKKPSGVRSKSISYNNLYEFSAGFASVMIVLNVIVATLAFIILGSNGASRLNNKLNATYGYTLTKNSKLLLENSDENGVIGNERMLKWFSDRGVLLLIVNNDSVIYNSTGMSVEQFFGSFKEMIGYSPEYKYTTGQRITKDGTLVIAQDVKNGVTRRVFALDKNFTFDSLDAETINSVLMLIGIMAALDMTCLLWIVISRHIYTNNVRKGTIEPLEKLRVYVGELTDGYYDDEVYYGVDNEIGDIYKAVDKIRLMLKEYVSERANSLESKRVLVSGLMHDIATPMTRINGCASMIHDGMATDVDTIHNLTDTILQNTGDINEMLKRLAEIARYDETVIKTHMLPVNVSILLKSYSSQIAVEIEKMDADIEIVDNCSPAPICSLDVKSCKRVLMNVLFNSIKYKKPDEHCHIRLGLDYDADGNLIISVADNGRGVKAGTENKIFDMFYREDSARRDIKEGSGLGLFVSRELVMINNGKIWARNNDNGLTIFVSFPTTKETPVQWN